MKIKKNIFSILFDTLVTGLGLTLPLSALDAGTESESGAFLVFTFESFKIPSNAWYALDLIDSWSESSRSSQSAVERGDRGLLLVIMESGMPTAVSLCRQCSACPSTRSTSSVSSSRSSPSRSW